MSGYIQYAIKRKTLIRVHVKINPKASVLNMSCYYVTVVDCGGTSYNSHDSCISFFK